MSYKSIKVEQSVYDKLSKAGSLGSTYSEVIDNALDVYLKQAARR
jgi:predicted CopG family antitoxin